MRSDKYLLVDLSNFVFRFAKSKKRAEFIGEDIRENLESFASSLLCNRIIVFQDDRGSDFRKGIYPEYKGNRKKEGKFYEELKDFFKKLPTITKILNIHFPVIKIRGVEADDTIFYVSQLLKNCVILSSDKDLLQCGVLQFSHIHKKYMSVEDEGFVNVPEFILCKAIAGDSGDNIKGLERVGMKTAKKYVDKYSASTFNELCASIPKNSKSKIEQRILAGEEVYKRNTRLVDLALVNDDVISPKIKEEIRVDINEFYN